MNPDKKYMFQVNLDNTDIKFSPPPFINKNFRDNITPIVNDNSNLDLFSSETGLPELCYYSKEFTTRNPKENIDNDIPNTFDILRNIDLDLNETEDLERVNSENDVNKIYFKIEQRHPGIFATLYSYRIPRPIVRVIVKRLIRLTLSYCDRENNY